MKKKLTCHCGGVEAEVKVPENGFEKISEVIKIASLCMKSKSLFLIEIGYGQ